MKHAQLVWAALCATDRLSCKQFCFALRVSVALQMHRNGVIVAAADTTADAHTK
jgi:hypothetical protein